MGKGHGHGESRGGSAARKGKTTLIVELEKLKATRGTTDKGRDNRKQRLKEIEAALRKIEDAIGINAADVLDAFVGVVAVCFIDTFYL
jgi:hypothetical protein